mmetsp:Transcript_11975/g.35312  ORF Transcript_11975/g.35312 Transcript_11975/m.35312 type:complete len:244 (-) Transcript_11975:972-1703(-)
MMVQGLRMRCSVYYLAPRFACAPRVRGPGRAPPQLHHGPGARMLPELHRHTRAPTQLHQHTRAPPQLHQHTRARLSCIRAHAPPQLHRRARAASATEVRAIFYASAASRRVCGQCRLRQRRRRVSPMRQRTHVCKQRSAAQNRIQPHPAERGGRQRTARNRTHRLWRTCRGAAAAQRLAAALAARRCLQLVMLHTPCAQLRHARGPPGERVKIEPCEQRIGLHWRVLKEYVVNDVLVDAAAGV